MGSNRLSTHFLKRRADARKRQIKRWQRQVKELAPSDPVAGRARSHLAAINVTSHDQVVVKKRGKWDARYDVLVGRAE